jgi:hypothetical protein
VSEKKRKEAKRKEAKRKEKKRKGKTNALIDFAIIIMCCCHLLAYFPCSLFLAKH